MNTIFDQPFTHLATIGRNRNVPVRWDGRFWWSRYEVNLGIVHSKSTVSDLRPGVSLRKLRRRVAS